MQKINIIGNKRNCFNRHLHPVFSYRKALLDEGVDISFFSGLEDSRIFDCDRLIFMADGYRDILPITTKSHEHATEYLQKLFRKFSYVIWFDDNDSSGTLNAPIFPCVDSYLKSQLLKNTGYYLESHLTGSIHRDYVFNIHGINDRGKSNTQIKKDDLHKLKLAWNLAFVNWNYYLAPNKVSKLYYHFKKTAYHIDFIEPSVRNRSKNISFRGRTWKTEPTVGWWRDQTIQKIFEFDTTKHSLSIDPSTVVSRRKYIQELTNALVTPSPFGKGEICYRDFECFISGSILFKAQMNHLRTWPDLYIEDVTYIPHKWDFSDFSEKLESIISRPSRYEEIAREGQRQFKEAIQDGEGFAKYLKNIIGL